MPDYPVIIGDFESYYNSEEGYTLKKMSTEEYVRDSRYESHMLALATLTSPVHVIPGEKVQPFLDLSVLPEAEFVGHNNRFDAFIMAEKYGISPARIVCTQAMSRWTGVSRICRENLFSLAKFFGLQEKGEFIHSMDGRKLEDLTPAELEKYKRYNQGDVVITRDIYKATRPLVPDEIMDFISMTIRMYTEPVLELDVPLLQEYVAKLEAKQDEDMERIQHMFSFADRASFLEAIRSKDKLAAMFRALGVEPPLKVSDAKVKAVDAAREELQKILKEGLPAIPKEARKVKKKLEHLMKVINGGVMDYAFAKSDLEFLALAEDDDDDVALLAQVRMENNSSIKLSRARTFLAVAGRGKMPVPLTPFQARTGRYSAGNSFEDQGLSDKLNIQNLNSRGDDKTLKTAIKAAKGYKLLAADSSQIECRVLAWIAGQADLVKVFRDKDDPYVKMATAIYHEDYAVILDGAKKRKLPAHVKQRQVGKTTILGSGYGMGAEKFAMSLRREKLWLGEEGDETFHNFEAARINKVYRNTNDQIVNFWWRCEDILDYMIAGKAGHFGYKDVLYYDGRHKVFGEVVPGIRLPNGFWILYPNLRIEWNKERKKWNKKYTLILRGKPVHMFTRGASIVENCLAEGTKVLTEGGWKPIESIREDERVFDGTCFVSHGAVVCRGIQGCIEVEGVGITPDHKILQKGSWINAEWIQRPDRPDFWRIDSYKTPVFQWEKMGMGVPVRLRNLCATCRDKGCSGDAQRRYPYVQCLLCSGRSRAGDNARYEPDAFLPCMEEHGRSLYEKVGSGLEQLWRAWNKGLREMAQVREFLRGYFPRLSALVDLGSDRQRRRLYPREYSMDNTSGKFKEQANIEQSQRSRHIGEVRDIIEYNKLPDSTRLAGRAIMYSSGRAERTIKSPRESKLQKVYDILNCGPRKRFVVASSGGGLIVHNCVQGLAFAMLAWQGTNIDRELRETGDRIVANCHDSWIGHVLEANTSRAIPIFEKYMRATPPWMPEDLPLDIDPVAIGDNYGQV